MNQTSLLQGASQQTLIQSKKVFEKSQKDEGLIKH